MNWRDVKNKARSQVHATFGLPATYTPPSGSPIACRVRVTDTTTPVGDFDSNGMADQAVSVPELRFLVSEVTPTAGGVVAITDGPSYRIEYVYPVDGITVTAEASRV